MLHKIHIFEWFSLLYCCTLTHRTNIAACCASSFYSSPQWSCQKHIKALRPFESLLEALKPLEVNFQLLEDLRHRWPVCLEMAKTKQRSVEKPLRIRCVMKRISVMGVFNICSLAISSILSILTKQYWAHFFPQFHLWSGGKNLHK